MRALTWNVLHRVHGERHGEEAVKTWPDEARRTRRILDLLDHALTKEHCEAVLLQEVSGDVLAALRERFDAGFSVVNHRYVRAPRPTPSVADPSEHLVVIAPKGSRTAQASGYASDGGKGFLAVTTPGGATVVSTHVSWGDKRADQLVALGQALDRWTGLVVVGGDFNVELPPVQQALRAHSLVLPADGLATREAEGRRLFIDHLLVRAGELKTLRVLEHEGLSDHRPVLGDAVST